MQEKIEGVICLCGNDGTGKSTLHKLFGELYPQYLVLERSAKNYPQPLKKIHQEIKRLDQLTFRYAFEPERAEFEPSHSINLDSSCQVPVHWILLDLDPTTINKRIGQREQMSIYESKRCIEYFSFVYLQLAAYYGMTIVRVDSDPQSIAQNIAKLIQSGATKEIRSLNMKSISIKKIQGLDISHQVIESLTDEIVEDKIKEVEEEIKNDSAALEFYYPELQELLYSQGKLNMKLGRNLVGRWIATHHKPSVNTKGEFSIIFSSNDCQKQVLLQSPCFNHTIEGESKQIYQVKSKLQEVTDYYSDKVWIILKSTIYSHTHQHTGEIQHLGQIRAKGSNLFLQMLRRNNLHHAYIAVNAEGVIFSRKIEVNMLEVVFKKQCVGTDKHSYHGLTEESELVGAEKKLKNGIYIRFDWRNPNHIVKKYPKYLLNQNKYYYVVEKSIGKEIFFDKFLRKDNLLPIGDKCITEDLIKNYVDTQAIKKAALSLYCTFAYYCRRVNLEIVDGCFMFNKDGSIAWSEINPDCMRVKKIEIGQEREDYDKDIWRIGGSSSKQKIKEKWTLFNKLLISYFDKNRYFEAEIKQNTPYFYTKSEQALRFLTSPEIKLSAQYKQYFTEISQVTQTRRQVIATIDISQGKPTLVKSSALTENHSDNSLDTAYEHLSVLPKIVLVDLDAAIGKDNNNRESIKHLKRKGLNNIAAVGGGIRSLEALNFYLNQLSVPKVILSSNLDLLDHLSKEVIQKRIIVELSINQNNEVLTHGRTVNTGENIIKKMVQLCRKGVKVVSLTFNHKEGHLSGIPRQQFRDIMFTIPGPINKVIIAGGITSVDDLEFIWGFPKALPQLGSAIWKRKIQISDLLCKIVNFKDEICPAIITSQSGKLLGEVFMNQEAINKTVQTRFLHRYSRKLGRLSKKGEQSGNIQKVIGVRIDCDSDCMNIIVEDSERPFCHCSTKSCFDDEKINSFDNVGALQQHILTKKITGSGYSKKMQENENFSALKILEESYQFVTTKRRVVEEGADVLAHMLMYLNAKNIPIASIISELDSRANKMNEIEQLVLKSEQKLIKKEKFAYMGLMDSKHVDRLDKAAFQLLGVTVSRGKHRSLKINLEIHDQQKYDKYFKDCLIEPIMVKSKDMSQMLFKKEIKWCFNYSIMMDNYPKIWKQIVREPIDVIKLCVIKKKNRKVDPLSWTKHNKGKVISEYPLSMINYLDGLGIDETVYNLYRVNGSSEAYLESDNFDYCDAIVETGTTFNVNDLEIVEVLCNQIYGGLYTLL